MINNEAMASLQINQSRCWIEKVAALANLRPQADIDWPVDRQAWGCEARLEAQILARSEPVRARKWGEKGTGAG